MRKTVNILPIKERLKAYADTDALICELMNKCNQPEMAELFESLHTDAYAIVEYILGELKIKGKVKKSELQEYLDYEKYTGNGLKEINNE